MRETPLHISGIHDNIYAGFGLRLASLLLDGLIFMPLSIAVLYLNSSNLYGYYYTFLPMLLIALFYNIYLPKRYGGTLGKRINNENNRR